MFNSIDQIDELEILHKLYGEITITEEIAQEFGKELPEWIKVVSVKDKKYQNAIMATLDLGEASALAFAVEQEDCLLIIDDNKGRRFAKQLGIPITGTIGLIINAKNSGLVETIRYFF